MNPGDLLVGLALAIGVAVVAHRAHALTVSGSVAAVVAGTLAVAAGWGWAIVLITYFAGTSLISRYRTQDKDARSGGRTQKHGARDAIQVVANGGAFSAFALGYAVQPDPIWQTLAAGAIAASAADTWATEVGVLARATPRSILTWKPVDAGTSGGITGQGVLGSAAGAALVALTAAVVRWPTPAAFSALLGGIAGSLIDSVVGASLQSRRWCASCGSATEQRIHRCGTVTARVGGLAWLDNDGVNAIATLGGALFGATTARLFHA